MIIDIDAVQYLNETGVTEALSGEINTMFGYIFLFIGIVFLYIVFNNYKSSKRKLKKW